MLFTHCAEQWLERPDLSPATRRVQHACYKRELYPVFKDRRLEEITEADVRGLCDQVKARGAPGTAVRILGILKVMFNFAVLNGYKGENPARFVTSKSIARFAPRLRVLSRHEIGLLHRLIGDTPVKDYYRLAIWLLLLTLTRRGELLLARWQEIDFEQKVWNLPPGRVKSTRTRQVYLSTQALDIFVQLKTMAGRSDYIFPSPLDSYAPMAPACLDIYVRRLCRRAQKCNLSLRDFAPSDLRRTAEEHLKQAKFDIEWVALALAREEVLRRLHIHESDQHAVPLRHMSQEWANMVDAWASGGDYVPAVIPPSLIAATPQDVI